MGGKGKGGDGREEEGGERREVRGKGRTPSKNPGYGLVRLLSDCFPPACSAAEFD